VRAYYSDSHNMPHVLKAQIAFHIHRLGKRAADCHTNNSHSMSDAVAIMTGAMERRASGEAALSGYSRYFAAVNQSKSKISDSLYLLFT